MGAAVKTTREAWIRQGLEMLAAGGPDSVRVEAVASALGVTKGGFYGQFADRQDLLDAMLDTWEKEAVDDALRAARAAGSTDVKDQITRAGVATLSPGRLQPIDFAVRHWARQDAEVNKRLRRVDTRRMDFLRSQFARLHPDPDEVEARSLLAFCLAVGNELLPPGVRGSRNVLDTATRIITE